LLTDPEKARALRAAARSNLEWLSIERASNEYLALYSTHMMRSEMSPPALKGQRRNV
jgi:hypothetical protein